MTESARSRDPLLIALISLLVLVVVGGLGLALAGVGADPSQTREIRLTVYADRLLPDVASLVEVGNPIFTDPGGMVVGEIVAVEVSHTLVAVPDASGELHAREDPTQDAVTVTIAAEGREVLGVVAIDNQVIQAGMDFVIVTNEYMVEGVVTGVEFQ